MKFQKSGLLIAAVGVVLTALYLLTYYPVGFAREDKRAPKSAAPAVRENDKVSTAPDDTSLAREIDRIIGESKVPARWGVFVISQKDGRVLYSRDADKSFTPASNMKVYTTAVALDLLGADYRWRTSVYASKQPDTNGVARRRITFSTDAARPIFVSRPKGDAPSLVNLADQLYQAGSP